MSLWDSFIGVLTAEKRNLSFSISRRFSWTGYTQKEDNMTAGPWSYFNEKDDPLIVGLDNELMAKLDMARGKAGCPFVITSGKRTPEQNAGLSGAVEDSAHLTGLAVDLAVNDDHQLFSMIFGLIQAGFRRIGIYYAVCSDNPNKFVAKHIHCDIAIDKPLDVIWSMLEKN